MVGKQLHSAWPGSGGRRRAPGSRQSNGLRDGVVNSSPGMTAQDSDAHPRVGGYLTSWKGVARLGLNLARSEAHKVVDAPSRMTSTSPIYSAHSHEEIR
jgi:hypothetical protein